MFVELVDSLRCIAAHEDTWLVAAVAEFRGRYIARGSLGCPSCRSQYEIDNGEVAFGRTPGRSAARPAPEPDDVLRARALMDLAEPGGVVALVGSAARLGPALEEETQTALLLINPAGVRTEPGLSTVWVNDRLPLAPGTLRAALVGDADVSLAFMRSLVTALRPAGRLVAHAAIPVPSDVTELARDDREWVAERVREQLSAPVTLRRA
jgi:hypothetical protein